MPMMRYRMNAAMPGSLSTPERGFTLIEMMIAFTILAILVTVSAPAIRDMVLNGRLTSQATELMADLAMARSESSRRGVRVAICKNATGGTANTACSTTSAWTDGWLMFVDTNNDGSLTGGETLLRVHQALPAGTTLTATPAANFVQARPSGNITPAGTVFKMCDTRTGNVGRTVTIAATGRASMSSSVACP